MDERLKKAIEELVEESNRPDIENTETHKLIVEIHNSVVLNKRKPYDTFIEADKICNEKIKLATEKYDRMMKNSPICLEYERISKEFREFSDMCSETLAKECDDARADWYKVREELKKEQDKILVLFGFEKPI
jgi:hypothetical protein